MTERLYYHDSDLLEFDAVVTALVDVDGRQGLLLDRTAFYPSSGGQPFDTGMLGGARVVDVIDGEDGTIVHVVDGIVAPGPVRGVVDADRRRDHVQQHSGQHVLSAAFERTAGVRTVSFHLGPTVSTIDLDREVTQTEIDRAETEACGVVWEDRPVTVSYVDAEAAAALPLRKPPARGGRLRIVDMDGYDVSACGGTHVSRTGAIGVIVATGTERVRGGTRVSFVCGTRALEAWRVVRDTMASSARLLSVLPVDVPGAIERMETEARESKRKIRELQSRVAADDAARLASSAEEGPSFRFVVAALDGADAAGLKTVASAIVSRVGCVAVVISSPSPSAIVVARSAGVDVDCRAVLRSLIDRHGGKGGGKADLAQGGGLAGSIETMLEGARAMLRQA